MIKRAFGGHLKLKILIGFVLSLIAIILAGVLAFRGLQELQQTTVQLSSPNQKLIKFQEIFYEVSTAESAVRTYLISKDDSYLSPYFSALYRVERKLDTLRLMSASSPEDQARIDTLSALLDEKIELYADLIDLKKDQSTAPLSSELLAKIERDMQRRTSYRKEVVPTITLKEEEKKNVFNRLKKFFGSDDVSTEVVAEPDTVIVEVPVSEQVISKGKVQAMVDQSLQAAERRRQTLDRKELEILKADIALMEQIKLMLFNLQMNESAKNLMMAREAHENTRKTIRVIAGIIILLVMVIIVFLFMVFQDISRSNRFREELMVARSEAEKLAHVKEQLLANMSHEIRTPLNAILGFSEQLSQSKLDQQQHEHLDALRRSSDLLLHTVNDILHFSKLEAGKLKIEEIPFKMEDILTDTLSTLKDTAEKKGLDLEYTMDQNFKQILVGDPYRLKQILINLAGNGIKFTDKGKIAIELLREDENNETISGKFLVIDTGIGISSDKLDTIFEEFSQADTSITRKFGGTGLGLTIVKKLVHLLDGKIKVRSRPGGGTEFEVVIPFKKAKKGVVVKEEKTVVIDPRILEGRKVLLVDDDEMNQLLGKTILSKWKVDLDQAYDGKEALKKIKANLYEVVLMDIQMPELSGIDVTKAVRSKLSPPNSETPILAVTANVIKRDIETYMAAGMNDYLLKPYKERDLYRKIVQAMGIKNNGNGKEQNGEKNLDHREEYNLEDLHKLAGHDPRFMLKFLKTFIREAEQGNNNMLAMLQDKKYEDIPAVAHRLISSMVHVGANRVVPILRELEQIRKGETPHDKVPALVVKAVDMINHVLQLIYTEITNLRKNLPTDEEK